MPMIGGVDPEGETRLNAVLAAYFETVEADGADDRETLLARHPDLADELRAYFTEQEELFHLASPLRTLLHAEQSLALAVSNQTSASQTASAEASPSEQPPLSFGDYELLEQIGQGGMGVVYRARLRRLDRVVALKMIRSGPWATPADVQRFRAEAEVVATLDHPHIVPIYDIGQHAGQIYFSMKLLDGGNLADIVAGRQAAQMPAADVSLPSPGKEDVRRSAALVRSVALAVHHAHQRGVLHRDLKPSNILLDAEGIPHISDFGLAKRTGTRTDLTQSGAILGTPEYLAPEQVSGQRGAATTAVDVYGLGGILYALLTGRPPLRGATPLDTLTLVKQRDPDPPSHHNPRVDRDLEAICLKCLEKDPHRRYGSAVALAEDLARWLAGEPTLARPTGRLERAWRWCRRNRVAMTTATLLALALLGGTAISTWQTMRARRALKNEEDQRQATQRALEAAEASSRAMEDALADLHTSQGIAASDPRLAALWFAHAARLARSDPQRERANRDRLAAWGRNAITPVRALPHPDQTLSQMTFHPGGRHLLTLSQQQRCVIWDLEEERALTWTDGKQLITCAVWSPDGRWLAWGTPEGNVDVRSFPDGELGHQLVHGGPVRCLAFSPDGRLLAVASDVVRLWNCRTNTYTEAELVHPQPVLALAFHPSGDRLATACQDGQARAFAISGNTAQPLFPPVPHLSAFPPGPHLPPTADVIISPLWIDQLCALLTLGARERLDWRDAATGEIRRTATVAPLGALACSPDSTHIAYASHSMAMVFDVADPSQIAALGEGHSHWMTSVAFSPDGATLLTGAGDRTARLWSVADGSPIYHPLDHASGVDRVAYSPDGQLIATGQSNGLVRVWRLPYVDARRSLQLGPAQWQKRLSLRGDYMAVSGYPTARAYEITTGKPAGPMLAPGGEVIRIVLAPDGRTAALVNVSNLAGADGGGYSDVMLSDAPWEGSLQFWDWRAGGRLFDPTPLPSRPHDLAYSPDGQRVVVACRDGEILLANSIDGQIVMRLEHKKQPDSSWIRGVVRFVPDGSSFLTAGLDSTVWVWETATGNPRFPPLKHQDICYVADISGDGRRLLTVGRDDTARVWDLHTGMPLGPPLPHPDDVQNGCFHPNGEIVLTACRDGAARLWDGRAGRMIGTPMGQNNRFTSSCVAFSQDGRRAITLFNGAVGVWDWQTGKPVAPPHVIVGDSTEMSLAPDGKRVVAFDGRGIVVFDLDDPVPSDELDVDDLCLQAELLSGRRIQEGDSLLLTTDEWLQRWCAFRERHPGLPALRTVDPATWDRHMKADLATARRRRGDAYVAQQKYEQAVAAYRECLVLDPDDPVAAQRAAEALNNLAWGLATAPEVAARNPSRAVALASEALELTPSATYFNTLGVACYRAGDWQAAIDALAKSEKSQPGTNLGFNAFFLAMAHAKLGHEQEARDWYDRAVAWMDKYQSSHEELRRFRAEAEEVLKIARQAPPEDGTLPSKP